MSQFDTIIDGALHAAQSSREVAIVYSRGVDSVTIAAVVGQTPFEQTDEYGVSHQIESRDYIVIAADLILAGLATLPQAGDVVVVPVVRRAPGPIHRPGARRPADTHEVGRSGVENAAAMRQQRE